ncbi:MAG: hypothetical protein RSF94_03170 [Rikenellaceae bacterium]
MKRILSLSVAVVSVAMLLTSCNCLKNAQKRSGDLKASATPEVLALKGSKVPVEYQITIPAKFVAKKAIAKVTPVLITGDKEQVGVTQFVQGPKVKNNYRVIPAIGDVVKYSDSFDFVNSDSISKLELRASVMCKEGGEYSEVYKEVIALGISQVQNLLAVATEQNLKTSADNFKRVSVESKEANIMFEINKADVRPSQLKSSEIAALEKFIADNKGADRRTLGTLYSKSYASPDGALDFNNKLADNRSKTTKKAMDKTIGANKHLEGVTLDVDALGEDWDGFKTLVEASNIPDKDLVLQVLSMYSDPEQRDKEIANMTSVFEILKEKILPELRRSKLAVDVEIQGLTDDELKATVNADVKKLNLEEMLYAATLFQDPSTKVKVYSAVTEKYPNDFRGWNNLGKYYAIQCNMKDASSCIKKAASLNGNSSDVVNNLGVVAMMDGNMADAKKYFESINTPESKVNMSIISVLEGNYDKATGLEGYNKAVVATLRGNLTEAQSILKDIDCPQAAPLKAVVAAKKGNKAEAMEILAKAKETPCSTTCPNIAIAEKEIALIK